MRLLAVLLAVSCCASACGGGNGAVKIGILLPRTPTFAEPLSWALANINTVRIDGKKVELVYAKAPTTIAAARAFATDPSIVAVVGPETSNEVFADASLFVAANKPLITPSATSADIYRAFSHTGDIWRTVESDAGQIQAALHFAGSAHSVALLTGTDLYGSTFFDSFGFSAQERGRHVTGLSRYDEAKQSCAAPLRRVLATHPQVLLAVPSTTAATVCIARRAHGTRVIFADAGEDAAAVRALGPAEPIGGVAPSPAPGNGFAQAFRRRFGHDPTAYAAQTYDALTLLAYALERDPGAKSLSHALARVVAGRGARTGWNGTAALRRIAAGGTPNVTGAGGPLDYNGTDPTSTAYAAWHSTGGGFATTASALFGTTPTPSPQLRSRPTPGGAVPTPRHALWALLVAASSGEQNYRHQADVLAQYQVLRENGVPDDHIVLVLADDLGPVVPYVQGGANLHRNITVDYHLSQVTAQGLLDILAGRRSSAYPHVIDSAPGDDVYVYIAGHGNENGVYVGLNEPVPLFGAYTLLAPAALDATVRGMTYRRLLIAIEACQSGVYGARLHAPNALLLAAASPVENSLATNYDPKTGTWLADAFSFDLWHAEQADPAETLGALYTRLYLALSGQHVSAYGSGAGSSLREFISAKG